MSTTVYRNGEKTKVTRKIFIEVLRTDKDILSDLYRFAMQPQIYNI